jgi:hypothetical protein
MSEDGNFALSVIRHPASDLRIGGVAGYCPRVRMVYYDGHLSP